MTIFEYKEVLADIKSVKLTQFWIEIYLAQALSNRICN
ncbi:hypothetical protein CLV48_11849 [Cecembia rubra]|uniref:Uncharacterized protein n=1 Tax=Cecembia rubra TaxID=1485585 RepID=A0A2P8DNH3_9BACT|nr:hypothetical protein CLV48_11849 [Cecembia rubra]